MDSCIRRCKQNKGIVGTNRFESGLCNFPLNLVQRAIFNCACRRSLAEYVVKKSSKHIKLILVLKIYWILVVSIQAACKNVVKCFARDLGSSHRETLVKKKMSIWSKRPNTITLQTCEVTLRTTMLIPDDSEYTTETFLRQVQVA